MKVQDLRRTLEQQKGKKEQIEMTISTLQGNLKSRKISLLHHQKAREVIRTVSIKTQQQLQYHISDITSMALESIFTNPYRLEVEFVERRNKTECDLYFVREGERVDPLSASGGGAVDVASFALRVASWSMMNPRGRNTIILDEPFRFLSADNQEKASVMLKELSHRMGIQFIIVTHEPILAAYADKIFEVKIAKGRSKVNS